MILFGKRLQELQQVASDERVGRAAAEAKVELLERENERLKQAFEGATDRLMVSLGVTPVFEKPKPIEIVKEPTNLRPNARTYLAAAQELENRAFADDLKQAAQRVASEEITA